MVSQCTCILYHCLTDSSPVVPVDIVCNQIIALTAASHHTSRAQTAKTSSCGNVPVYHIAAGSADSACISLDILNSPSCKLSRPYIPTAKLLQLYTPMFAKRVLFDTTRTQAVIGTQPDPTSTTADRTVDCAGFDIDVAKSFALHGGHAGYLQMVRDIVCIRSSMN